jgi:hypothetical protein
MTDEKKEPPKQQQERSFVRVRGQTKYMILDESKPAVAALATGAAARRRAEDGMTRRSRLEAQRAAKRRARREELFAPESRAYLDSMKEHDAKIYRGEIEADDGYLDRWAARNAHARGWYPELVEENGKLSFRHVPIYTKH